MCYIKSNQIKLGETFLHISRGEEGGAKCQHQVQKHQLQAINLFDFSSIQKEEYVLTPIPYITLNLHHLNAQPPRI